MRDICLLSVHREGGRVPVPRLHKSRAPANPTSPCLRYHRDKAHDEGPQGKGFTVEPHLERVNRILTNVSIYNH